MPQASSIWEYPASGKAPDTGWATGAPDLAAFCQNAAAMQNRAIAAVKKRAGINIDMLHQIQTGLAAKGIGFDIDKLTQTFETRVPVGPTPPDDLPFSLMVPLAMTHAMADIPLDAEGVRAETARLREALARQISSERGAATYPALADPQPATLALGDEDLRSTLSEVTHYWPPDATGPALALIERQEDGTMPIEVLLATHGETAHRRVATLLRRVSGTRK